MENKSYLVTLTQENFVEFFLCDEIPDFVHAVKYNNETGIDLYFSADNDWTPELEQRASEEIYQDFAYSMNPVFA